MRNQSFPYIVWFLRAFSLLYRVYGCAMPRVRITSVPKAEFQVFCTAGLPIWFIVWEWSNLNRKKVVDNTQRTDGFDDVFQIVCIIVRTWWNWSSASWSEKLWHISECVIFCAISAIPCRLHENDYNINAL